MATLNQLMQETLNTLDPALPNETKRIHLKELLQAYTLDFIYNHAEYRRLNFYGGTCLHTVYGLNRLSEDIDLDNSNQVPLESLEADLLAYFRNVVGVNDVTAKTQQGEWEILRTTLKFPVLNALNLTPFPNEALHLKVEVSQHMQTAIVLRTPLFLHGRSLVAAHFSLETMMAGKMIACLERNFKKGTASNIKGRDFYDLLWFMQQGTRPLEAKLQKDGQQPYTTASAMALLQEKVNTLTRQDLAIDLLPLFEQRSFIEAWLDAFHENFERLVKGFLD